jgi:hypothetical protein
MSAKEPEDRSFTVVAADGAEIRVRCPVCHGDQFGSARPPQDKRRLGFRHVIVGQEIEGGASRRSLALPIRFKYCLSCGYILKFMFLQGEKDWGEEN